MALAPVPMTATRLPVRSTLWSHCAEWKAGPWKSASPSMSGMDGMCSAPAPEIRNWVTYSWPSLV